VRRLRSLGYAAAPIRSADIASTSAAVHPEADDPKRLVGLNERFNAALEAFDAGRHAEALAAFRSLLDERRDFITARTSAATVLLSIGRAREAVDLLRAAPATQAAAPDLQAKLGAALRESGDPAGAAAAFERSMAAGDQNPELFNDLGVVYARLGRIDEARAAFRELLRRDANAAAAWNNLGVLELSARRPEAAADAFRQAVAADPARGDAWQGLGAALVERDRSAAVEAWRRAERLLPRDYDLLFNLGMVLAESAHPADALPYLERFRREAPRSRYAADLAHVDNVMRSIQR
jgi:tetratricopeptide (TPR) repeat protein